jgi:hypothetical protein
MIIMLVKYVSIDGIPQVFLSFRIVDIIVITVHDRFWNVGQAVITLREEFAIHLLLFSLYRNGFVLSSQEVILLFCMFLKINTNYTFSMT